MATLLQVKLHVIIFKISTNFDLHEKIYMHFFLESSFFSNIRR
jgi:hypothetical protein